MTTYQVIGQCAHVTVEGLGGGLQKQLLYRGSVVPDTATPEEIKHLLSVNAIAAVGEEPFGTHEVGGAGTDPARAGIDGAKIVDGFVGDAQPTADPAEQKRVEARAKLTEIGGVPDGRSSEAVWVEYAVSKGTDRSEAEKAGKAALMDLYKK